MLDSQIILLVKDRALKTLKHLFDNNLDWSTSIKEKDPDFFKRLSKLQSPEYLWIGCADSRVPANQIIKLLPGEIFVHRNIANMVVHTDLNCLSVLQFAIDVLNVKHIIICGHYGCGGIKAAMEEEQHGIIDNWLRHIKDVIRFNQEEYDNTPADKQFDLLCELNVKEQVNNVCNTTFLQNAWESGKDISVHGWIYSIQDGILRSLETITNPNNLPD